MKLVRWTRFTWELKKLPPLASKLPEKYLVRQVERGEEKTVSDVIFSAFLSDSAWSDAFNDFKLPLQNQLDALFQLDDMPALVVCHGQRIIGASALVCDVNNENHLLSGPCVLMEYRNRGLGTALLEHSLKHLQTRGLQHANGVTKSNVVACKFIYPKFDSTRVECEFEPALAGSQ